MSVEQDRAAQAANPPKRSLRWLAVLVLAVLALSGGSAAGALGYLAPVHVFLSGLRPAPREPLPVFYALPAFRLPLDGLSNLDASSPASGGRHLKAIVQLEVAPTRLAHVEALQPRIVDTLITFLRVLNERDIVGAYGLNRLKAQILHRVREVAGEDAVRSVLITEFVIL